MFHPVVAIAAITLFALPLAHAQSPAPAAPTVTQATPKPAAVLPADVLLSNGTVQVTRADWDLEMERIPPDLRPGFAEDVGRVSKMLNNMLITRSLAAKARETGIDKRPDVQQRLAVEIDKALAGAYFADLELSAGKEFDARPGMELVVRDRWLGDASFREPEKVSVTHVDFDVAKRGKDEALKLAQETRAKVLAGADMNALAREISDDPAASKDGGRSAAMVRDKGDPDIARAAFGLKRPGDVSEPVLARGVYTIIRLDARTPAGRVPFAEVKEQILAGMRLAYIEERKAEQLARIRNDPQLVLNDAAVDALITRVDPEMVRKANEEARRAARAAAAPK